MRSAVEALPSKGSSTATSPSGDYCRQGHHDWDSRSSRSWRRRDDCDDRTLRPSKSDYYPGKFTEKLKSRSPDLVNGFDDSRSSTYGVQSSDSSSRVSSPTYPFLSSAGSSVSSPASSVRTVPVRGSTSANFPFPEYEAAKSPTSDYTSEVSTPTYPYARSSCVSPEPASDHTISNR